MKGICMECEFYDVVNDNMNGTHGWCEKHKKELKNGEWEKEHDCFQKATTQFWEKPDKQPERHKKNEKDLCNQ